MKNNWKKYMAHTEIFVIFQFQCEKDLTERVRAKGINSPRSQKGDFNPYCLFPKSSFLNLAFKILHRLVPP
jgi:hypothetical protein